MLVTVIVGVATSRPPKAHRFVRVIVSVEIVNDEIATAEREAEWTAIAIASAHNDVEMPVSSQIVEIVI